MALERNSALVDAWAPNNRTRNLELAALFHACTHPPVEAETHRSHLKPLLVIPNVTGYRIPLPPHDRDPLTRGVWKDENITIIYLPCET